MGEKTARYDFPKHVKGDTFDGVLFTVTVNNTALDLTDAVITMNLRLTADGASVKSFSTAGSAGITIINPPTGGVFRFDAQVIDISAENYYYDIQIVLSNGLIKTYIYGRWIILQDITHT